MFRGIKVLLDYILSVVRISVILSCALFMPRFFIHYVAVQAQPHNETTSRIKTAPLKLGLENISDEVLRNLTPKKDLSYTVGLFTNHTGKDQSGDRNIDILLKKGLTISAIFVPKQGLDGTHAKTINSQDPKTSIPLIDWSIDSEVKKEAFSAVDIVMFDIQDSGVQQGCITTLMDVMKSAAHYKKKLVILDRPNLLGSYIEGLLSESNNDPSMMQVPARHGMTVGELAHYFNQHVLLSPADLYVVPMEHYSRHTTDLPKAYACQLSPTISTVYSNYSNSFLGLLAEVAPFDIGIGTHKAFQCLLLPESSGVSRQKWYTLSDLLKKHGIESKYYRYFNDRKETFYTGLCLHISDINNFSSFSTLLTVLKFFKDSGVSLTFSKRFDSALGTDKVRAFIEGCIGRKELEKVVKTQLSGFYSKAMNSFIYKPLPQVIRV